jgi:YD repeat-containing protein
MKKTSAIVILFIVTVLGITSTPLSAAAITYTYDVMGRLTGADYGSGKVVQYTYDAMGNRTSQTAPLLPPGAPIVTTKVPIVMSSGVPPTVYAVFEGTVNANRASTTVTFEYGLTTAYGSSVPATPSPVTGITTTTVKNELFTGLALSTTYHHRVKAVSSAGTSYGNDIAFTTPSGVAPVVTATPTGGAYNGPVSVTLSCPNALMILYSIDGNLPSQLYSVPIDITATTTLQAYALTSSGMSDLMVGTYTINNSSLPVMIDGAPPHYVASIQEAFNTAVNGALFKVHAALFSEDLLLDKVGKTVTIKGGYGPTFTTQTGVTTVKGTLTIRKGGLVVDRVVIR